MPIGAGGLDAQGVWQYGEDDTEALHGDLLGLGFGSVSTQFALDRGRLDSLESTAARVGLACSLRKSANQNLTTSAAALTWDVEVADSAGMHSNAVNNSRMIAPVAGLYMVTFTLLNSNTSGMGTAFGRVNGSTDATGSLIRRIGDSSAATPLLSSFPVLLSAGDYVEIMVLHATAAGVINGGTSNGAAMVTMNLIGSS